MSESTKRQGVLHYIPKHIQLLTVLGVGILLVMIAVFVFITYAKPVKTNQQLKTEADSLLRNESGGSHVVNMKTITSELGFTLQYDANSLDSRAEVTDPTSTDSYVKGEDFTGEDVAKTRPYSLVKLTAKDDKSIAAQPEFNILTNIRKDHLRATMARPEYQGKSKLDVWVAVVTKNQVDAGYKVTSSTTLVVNGVTYTVIDFMYDSQQQYGIASANSNRYYLTVQNDRAYQVTILNINSETEKRQIPLLEEVLKTISYPQPDAAKFSGLSGEAHARLTASTLPQDNIKTPAGSIDEERLYTVVAKNQPAVVRIGASRCGTIRINFPDGTNAGIENVCNGGIGSGSFISSDGYIATNGHVTRVLLADMVNGYINTAKDYTQLKSRVAELTKYLVKLGVLTPEKKAALEQGIDSRDNKVLGLLSTIGKVFPSNVLSIENDTYHYAVQLGNEPMRVKDDLSAFIYTKTVIEASFIAADYYEGASAAVFSQDVIESGKSDVSILKVEGGPYPAVTLGSIDSVHRGDKLIALGFPSFVDGGVHTTQKYTVPSATSGSVISLLSDASAGGSGHKFITTTVPIAHGNSGGPAFNEKGEVVGINTYGAINCADQKCFGNGTARDIEDLKKLAEENNVKISSSSNVSEEWNKGLTAFREADYGTAATSFDKGVHLYPANYLAAQLGSIATENAPSLFRISQSDMPRMLLLVGIVAMTWAVLGCVIAGIVHVVRGQRRAHG